MTEQDKDADVEGGLDEGAETPSRTAVDEASLQQWIAAVVDQDQSALSSLYDALVGQVYGLALRITRQTQLAEEVVQDTFWQVWRQAPRFDAERGSAKAWVMTIARSRALDMLRSLDGGQCELEAETLALVQAPDGDIPPNLLMAVEQGHSLHTALAALEPLPRQLVALAFLRGLSHDEIAQCSGLPLGTVKTHIRRALLTLQQTLAATATEVR